MTDRIREELSRAELLLEQGKYSEALQQVKALAACERLSIDDRLACLLLKSRLSLKLGELKKAPVLADQVLRTAREGKNRLLVVDALTVKAEVSWHSGKLDEGLRAVEEGAGLLKELEHVSRQQKQIKKRKGQLLHQKGIIHWFRGDLDKALEHHRQSLIISEELGNKQGISDSLNNLGLVCVSKGDLNQALEYHQRSLAIKEELGNKQEIAKSLNNLGNVYSKKGDLNQALEYHQRSLAIKEELGNKHDVALSLLNVGVDHQLKGDLNQALEYYQRSLEISEKLGNKQDIALAINNLGNILELRGDLDQALKRFQRSLMLYKMLGIKENIALSLNNIGTIHRKKGNSKEALEYYQQSLAIYEKMGNDPLTAIILFELVWTALEKEDPAMAENYLQRLQQINEQTDNRIIDQRYRVAKALSLKTSNRARHKMKAAEILEQVVEEEVGDHSLTVTAMIHLCDLLLSELKMTGEDDLFAQIKDLTSRLLEIAKQQSSNSLLAQTYLLQSKLALIELDMGQARKFLTKAHLIAQEKGLHILALAAAHEHDLLQSHLHKWESIIEQKPSKREMIDLTKLDDFLKQMIQKTVANLAEEGISGKEVPKRKYELLYLDLLKDSQKIEKNNFRVAIAQIGVAKSGDILTEFYEEMATGLFRLRKDKVEAVRSKVKEMVEIAHTKGVNILLFPELTVDLNYEQLLEEMINLAKAYKMYIIPGSYHDQKTRRNISTVIGPEGILWQQEKHIPAIIHYKGERFKEGLELEAFPKKTIICNTEFGRVAITICRDFLDMDLRVELKNYEPPVDLIFNPAFTPVTADFKAAHFDARRSIYAYCFFANVAEFGGSFIHTPEKERVERKISPKEENLIYKDVELFSLRSERKKWEKEQKHFIQSTR